MRRYA